MAEHDRLAREIRIMALVDVTGCKGWEWVHARVRIWSIAKEWWPDFVEITDKVDSSEKRTFYFGYKTLYRAGRPNASLMEERVRVA